MCFTNTRIPDYLKIESHIARESGDPAESFKPAANIHFAEASVSLSLLLINKYFCSCVNNMMCFGVV